MTDLSTLTDGTHDGMYKSTVVETQSQRHFGSFRVSVGHATLAPLTFARHWSSGRSKNCQASGNHKTKLPLLERMRLHSWHARTRTFGVLLRNSTSGPRLEVQQRHDGILDGVGVGLPLLLAGLHPGHGPADAAQARRRLPPLQGLLAAESLVDARMASRVAHRREKRGVQTFDWTDKKIN